MTSVRIRPRPSILQNNSIMLISYRFCDFKFDFGEFDVPTLSNLSCRLSECAFDLITPDRNSRPDDYENLRSLEPLYSSFDLPLALCLDALHLKLDVDTARLILDAKIFIGQSRPSAQEAASSSTTIEAFLGFQASTIYGLNFGLCAPTRKFEAGLDG